METNTDNPTNHKLTNQPPTERPPQPSFGKLMLDMALSIAIPVFILRKFSGPEDLGPSLALVIALAFPLAAGIYDLIKDKKLGLVPSIGFISILLTGSIGLLKLPKEYIAIKEALVPLGFGLAVLISSFTKRPLVRTFVYNDMLMETEKVASKIEETAQQQKFDSVMVTATWILAGSFLLSSILNYALAKWIIVSETGTEAFNKEFGTMTLLSYPVIVVPSMIVTFYAMYYVISRILKMTGFELEEILRQ